MWRIDQRFVPKIIHTCIEPSQFGSWIMLNFQMWIKAFCSLCFRFGHVLYVQIRSGLIHSLMHSSRCRHTLFLSPCLQVSVNCCQRLLPLIIHSMLLNDSDCSWKKLLSSRIQDFFSFFSKSAQVSSRSATPPNSDSGKFETVTLLVITINVFPERHAIGCQLLTGSTLIITTWVNTESQRVWPDKSLQFRVSSGVMVKRHLLTLHPPPYCLDFLSVCTVSCQIKKND